MPLLPIKKKVPNLNLIYIHTPLHTNFHLQNAISKADQLSLPLDVVKVDTLKDENIRNNSRERCYYCKKMIFHTIINKYGPCTILEGGNFSEINEFRPGNRAIKELNVLSPFRDLKIGKLEILSYLEEKSLSYLISPSSTCIATRVNYNRELTPKLLKVISDTEEFLNNQGLKSLRVRVLEDGKWLIESDNIKKAENYFEILSTMLLSRDIFFENYEKGRFDKE